MDQYFDYIDKQKRGSTIKGVPSDVVKMIKIPKVPIEEQRAFSEFTEQCDKSKSELKDAINNVNSMKNKIVEDNFAAARKE